MNRKVFGIKDKKKQNKIPKTIKKGVPFNGMYIIVVTTPCVIHNNSFTDVVRKFKIYNSMGIL